MTLTRPPVCRNSSGVDGSNRYRAANDPDLFAAWRSASNVIGPAKAAKSTTPESPPSGGEIKPAA